MGRRQVLTLPLALAASGCASQLRLPDFGADASLAPGTGLLITRIISMDPAPGMAQRPDASLTLIDESNFTMASAILPIQPGENFRVISLPAGSYTWRGLYLGTFYSEFRGKLPFKVTANTATYIGDVDLQIDWYAKTYRLAVRDRSRIAQARYEEQYPRLAKSVPFEVALARDLRVK